MLVIFNQTGNEFQVDYQNDSFTKGDENTHYVDVIVSNLDDNINNFGYVQFRRNGDAEASPKLPMTPAMINQDGTLKKGYRFIMQSDWYCKVAGELKLTIEIKEFNETNVERSKAYGVVSIPIQESVAEDVRTTITDEEYIALINLINSKVGEADEKVYQFAEPIESDIDFANKVFTKQVELGDVNRIYFGNKTTQDERYNYIGIYNNSFGEDNVVVFNSKGEISKIDRNGNSSSITINSLVSSSAFVDMLKVNLDIDAEGTTATFGSIYAKDGIVDFTNSLSAKTKAPTNATDIANKDYVDKQIIEQGGTFVEGNVEGVATEELTKLKVKEKIYSVPSTTTIENKFTEVDSKFASVDQQITDVDSKFSDYIPKTEKGTNNGVATLGSDGKIPSDQLPPIKNIDVDSVLSETSENPVQNKVIANNFKNYPMLENGKIPTDYLPSYVDEFIEGTLSKDGKTFTSTDGTVYDASSPDVAGKLYLDIPTNTTYRWSGTQFSAITGSLSLGTTPNSAWYGDRGLATEDLANRLKDEKLDKKTENAIVYGTLSNGQQSTIQYNVEPYGDGLVQRTQNGRVKTTTPTENNDATNKEYVDNIPLTIKQSTPIEEITSEATFLTYFYNLRKNEKRKWQFEISPTNNQNIINAVGYPSGVDTSKQYFLYVDIPYSEAGGYIIELTLIDRSGATYFTKEYQGTLNSNWHSNGWKPYIAEGGTINAEVLAPLFQGDETIVVDLTQDKQKVEVHLDQVYKDSLATKEYSNTTYATKTSLNDYATKQFVQDNSMIKYHYYQDIHTIDFFNLISSTPKVMDGALFSVETVNQMPQEAINRGFPALQSGTILYGFYFNGQDESPIIIITEKGLYKITDGTSQTTCTPITENNVQDIITLEANTDILTYDYSSYKNNTWFKGNDLLGLPQEIVQDNKKSVFQLIKYDDTRYALMLFHTGIYESNVGTYINYHYVDKFKGWENLSGGGEVPSDLVAKVTKNTNDIANLQTDKQDKIIAGTNVTIGADGKTINASGGEAIKEVESLPQTPENVIYAIEKGIDTKFYARKNEVVVPSLNGSYRWKAIPFNDVEAFFTKWNESWQIGGETNLNVKIALGSTGTISTGIKIINNSKCAFETTSEVIFGYGISTPNEVTANITGANNPIRIVDDSTLNETEKELLQKFLSVWATKEA